MLIRDTFADIKVNIFYSAITNQARVNEGHFTLSLVPSIKKRREMLRYTSNMSVILPVCQLVNHM